jgi:hypothetical protein
MEGFVGMVVKKDAFCDTLKHVQAWLLVSKKEVAKLEGTQTHHFTNYIELSQRVKTAELLLSTTNQAKSILDNRVQTLERELVQRGVNLEGGTTSLGKGMTSPPNLQG